jgi:hypothetical protein
LRYHLARRFRAATGEAVDEGAILRLDDLTRR